MARKLVNIGNPCWLWPVICCALISIFLTGCVTLRGQKPNAEDLGETVEAFNSSVRWGDFQTASAMIPDQAQDIFWEDAETFLQNTRIAKMEIRSVKVDDETATGTAQISFTYYRLNDPSFRTLLLHQKWRFDQDRQAWLVEDSEIYRLLP